MAVTPCSAKKATTSQGEALLEVNAGTKEESSQFPRAAPLNGSPAVPLAASPQSCGQCWTPTEGAFLSAVGKGGNPGGI